MGSSRVRSTPPRLEGLKYRTYGTYGTYGTAGTYCGTVPAVVYRRYRRYCICMHTVCQLLRSCDPLAPEFESVNGCKKLD